VSTRFAFLFPALLLLSGCNDPAPAPAPKPEPTPLTREEAAKRVSDVCEKEYAAFSRSDITDCKLKLWKRYLDEISEERPDRAYKSIR
jgi:hypothetical protein